MSQAAFGNPVCRLAMMRVMEKHKAAVYRINADKCPSYLLRAAEEDWNEAVAFGKRYGYRNAQTTVIAPTGTIGLLMDCDTTGIEPDFSLIKFKKLAGGGYFKIVNQSVPFALKTLGYSEAEIHDIYFEPEFAKVIIHAEKPGLVIGKAGEILNKIKYKTFWAPDVKRAPVIDSELLRSIRKMLHKEAGYRKKFLHGLGEKIYGSKKDVEWIRVTSLGGSREVGRSCLLLQTPQSKVLLDCGIAVGSGMKPFPYLDASEFNIQNLDAIIISHAHLDHAGLVPLLYEYGFRGPMYCTRPTRDTMVLQHSTDW